MESKAYYQGSFPSRDGIHNCHYIIVRPQTEPKGIVQISHGMCEYIERYLDFAKFLSDNGYVVCGNDHLGHGHTADSPKELGYFSKKDGWQNAVADLHTMTKLIKSEYPYLPLILLGHSMGSFMARAYAVKYGYECAGFIFMGTADGFESTVGETTMGVCKELEVLDDKFSGKSYTVSLEHGDITFDPSIGETAAKLGEKLVEYSDKLGGAALVSMLTFGEIIKTFRGSKHRSSTLDKIGFGRNNERIKDPRTKYDWISRDREIVDKFASDPLCAYTFTVNGFMNLASVLWYVSNEKWYESVPHDKPILLLSGGSDPVGNYGKGVSSVFDRLVRTEHDVSYKLYKGARHELLNEINRGEVYYDILVYLNDVSDSCTKIRTVKE